jgi:molecular chaperone HscB
MTTSTSDLAPIAPDTDYFTYLLGEERLAIDLNDLSRRFHDASKRVHPDRFTRKGPEQQALSVEHSEFLNRAYRTLRDPLERAKYLLKRHGVDESAEKRVPVELAEEYFELEELAMEAIGAGPEAAAEFNTRLKEIASHLEATHQANMRALDDMFKAWDGQGDRPTLLSRMAKLIHDDNYARSMRRDIFEKFGV